METELLLIRRCGLLLAVAALAPAAFAQVSACAPCHAEIAAGFQKTGMGRSFYRMSPQTFPEKPYYHEASDSYFAMIERDGHVFQRRWQVGFDGKPANIEEKQVDFVLGSGNHARTYLHLTSRGTLQQLPLGWYAEKGGYWAMNPGYDRPDFPGSIRAVSYECMSCHNAYPKIPAASREEGSEARYVAPIPEGIDCQRCHGTGQEHIATAGKAAIVNPKNLPADRALEICMQCHLETTSRLLPHSIQKHGRAPFSYVPGQPLADFEATFDRAPGKNRDVEVAGGAYRFRQSKCFLKSQGKLTCTTCHNPHDVRHGEQAIAQYNRVCAGCHVDAHRAAENCVGCHMPKTRTDDAVHIVITDHWIQRGPVASNLTAEKAEKHETQENSYRGQVVPYYPANPSALYLAVAQIRDGSNLQAGLRQLSGLVAKTPPTQPGFYVDLGDGYLAAGDLPYAVRSFEEAQARAPESLAILLKLGNTLMELKDWTRAEAILRRATVRGPSEPLAWGLLGWSLWQQNKAAEAKADLEKSVKLDPELPDFHNDLGELLMATGDREDGFREFREAVRLEPGISEWRSHLAGQLVTVGAFPEARYEFDESMKFKPGDTVGRLGYARFLAATGDPAGAEKQARTAVGFAPNDADAHEVLGALLANRAQFDAAAVELQAAVKLDPGLIRAQYELGAVLFSKKDFDGAAEHLRIAAKAGDPEATFLLQKLGK